MNSLCTRFRLKASIGLGMAFVFIHAGAIYSVCFIPIFWALKLILVFFVFLSLVLTMRTHVLRNKPHSIIEFSKSISEEGEWLLKECSGKEHRVVIDYPIFISNYLIIINFIMSLPRGLPRGQSNGGIAKRGEAQLSSLGQAMGACPREGGDYTPGAVKKFIAKNSKKKFSLLIAKDALITDDFRKLKFVLRIAG